MPDCLFCRIAAGEIPGTKVVFESPTTLAFRDIHPKAPTHVLVVPKEHVASLMDFDDRNAGLIADLHRTIREVARLEKVDQSGFRVIVNNGKDSGQAVAHVHYHVLGGRRMEWPHG
jgi:histidine triad (HIT) family protein